MPSEDLETGDMIFEKLAVAIESSDNETDREKEDRHSRGGRC